MSWCFDERIWVKKWGFSQRAIRLLRPVAAQLEARGFEPDLTRHQEVLKAHFHRSAFMGRRKTLLADLAGSGESIGGIYYGIMEPANFFHEIWLYQHFKYLDTPKWRVKAFREHRSMVIRAISSNSPFSAGLKKRISAEFKNLTTDKSPLAAALEFIELVWTSEQRALIQSRLGRLGIEGRKSRERVHGWGDTARILSGYLKARKVKNYQTAAFRFLNLIYPDFVRWLPTTQARKDFMHSRRRRRISTKSGGTLA